MTDPGEHSSDSDANRSASSSAWFATTHWSVILRASGPESGQAHSALDRLCRAYWYPLYAFIRRKGHSPHDAQDLTQEFFARLLNGSSLAKVAPDKGKFRSFLLAALKHFLANEWDRRTAVKRGGQHVHLSIDAILAESRYGLEPAHEQSPEKIFERRWALTVLDLVLARLRTEFADAGKDAHFEEFKVVLTQGKGAISYEALSGRLGMTPGAVKVAVHRLRQRYRELLQAEIAQTVSTPEEVDEEIRQLFASLSGG